MPLVSNLIYRTSIVKHKKLIKTNLGDILRSTMLLKMLPDSHLLTDSAGYSLLSAVYPNSTRISLDRDSSISASRLFTFTDCIYESPPDTCKPKQITRIEVPDAYSDKPVNTVSWQQCISHSLKSPIPYPHYLEPRQSTNDPLVDVLLLHQVHRDWQSKTLNHDDVNSLALTLQSNQISVEVQPKQQLSFEELTSLIRNSKVIVSPETLSLHLSLALQKPTILLEGPLCTCEESSPLLTVVSAKSIYSCSPCFSGICLNPDSHCITDMALGSLIPILKKVLSQN